MSSLLSEDTAATDGTAPREGMFLERPAEFDAFYEQLLAALEELEGAASPHVE